MATRGTAWARTYLPRPPNQPRASTREEATVGVDGGGTPIKDRRRPSALNDETRGVAKGGKGSEAFDVSVMVEGVRVERVGEGGKTKSVWDGVDTAEVSFGLDGFCTLIRRSAGGSAGLRASARRRRGFAGVGDGGELTAMMGDDGTGGRMDRLCGLRVRTLESGRGVRSKFALTAVAGGGGILKLDLKCGAEGGIRTAGT